MAPLSGEKVFELIGKRCTNRMKWLLIAISITATSIGAVFLTSRNAEAVSIRTHIKLEEHQKHEREKSAEMGKRLDRMEQKIDRLLEKG